MELFKVLKSMKMEPTYCISCTTDSIPAWHSCHGGGESASLPFHALGRNGSSQTSDSGGYHLCRSDVPTNVPFLDKIKEFECFLFTAGFNLMRTYTVYNTTPCTIIWSIMLNISSFFQLKKYFIFSISSICFCRKLCKSV